MTHLTPITGTIDNALVENRSDGKSTYRVESQQFTGFHSEVAIRDYLISVDEPKALGGADNGPSPNELILAGLAASLETVYRIYADRLGIALDDVSVTVSGTIDHGATLAHQSGVRPGFQGIEVDVTLESDAPQAALEELKRVVDAHCPVLDALRNPTPVLLRAHVLGATEDEQQSFAGLAG